MHGGAGRGVQVLQERLGHGLQVRLDGPQQPEVPHALSDPVAAVVPADQRAARGQLARDPQRRGGRQARPLGDPRERKLPVPVIERAENIQGPRDQGGPGR